MSQVNVGQPFYRDNCKTFYFQFRVSFFFVFNFVKYINPTPNLILWDPLYSICTKYWSATLKATKNWTYVNCMSVVWLYEMERVCVKGDTLCMSYKRYKWPIKQYATQWNLWLLTRFEKYANWLGQASVGWWMHLT